MNINIKTLQVAQVETAPVQIDPHQLQQVTVVEVAGDIDTSTAPLVQAQVLPLAQAGTRMILDLTKVLYMSSAGLRVLLSLYRQISAQDGQIVLVGLSEEIKDTMSITGFLDFFKTCDTLDTALTTFNVKSVIPT